MMLKEDTDIRSYLNTLSKTASISNIQINRNGLGDQLQLNIETGRPGVLVGENSSNIKKLSNNLKKILPSNRQLTINIIEVEKVNLNASLVADLVVKQLEQRVAFKRAMREALQGSLEDNVSGIKVQVSGRLNGCLLYTSPSPRDLSTSRMPSSA